MIVPQPMPRITTSSVRAARRLLPVLIAAGCAAAPGHAGPAAAISNHDWGAAAREAGGDGLEADLVTYLRLIAPGAPPADYVGFLASHPDWPNRGLMHARYDAGLVADPDDASVLGSCRTLAPASAASLARCAAAARAEGGDQAAGWARGAWRGGFGADDEAVEASFLSAWGASLTPDDDWSRFETLAPIGRGVGAAGARQVGRLTGERRAVAAARVAISDGTDPLASIEAVPVTGQDDPGLALACARALRRSGANDAALGFWRTRAMRVEAGQPAKVQALFWAERDLLARALLADPGHDRDAFTMADDSTNAQAGARGDALFLTGWIALRRLADPGLARERFKALGLLSASVTTRARAAYWLARADAALGQQGASLRDDTQAASFPTTFYGQLSLAALAPSGGGADFLGRLRTALDAATAPGWTQAQAVSFASGEMARAAVLLVAWGQGIHAKAFLGEADAQANDPAAHALAATLAVKLGLPDEAVAIARRSGREGRALVPVGWPRPVEPPNILPAPLLLGLIRQESAFDAGAVSPSGALGLMQLLPGTASEVARANQTGPVGGRLTTDPALNMLLGAAYLKSLIVRDGGNVPEAVASYNAGPHRVSGWPPPPASPPPDAMVGPPDAAMVDWIETIPVSETRNYVQRVLENWAVYAATGSNGGQG